ncbi:MAG: DUF2232 domain-containing protein [Methylocystis sp.]
MPDKSDFSWSNISVAALGGVAGAAIFAVVIRGGLGGLFFAHLAPLPLMIIGLGFGLRHCVTAALLSTAILSIYPHPVIGMAYGLLVAAPAALAIYAAAGAPKGGRDLITQDIAGWASLAPASVISIVVIAWLVIASLTFGTLEEALNPIRARAFLLIDAMAKENEISDKLDPVALSGIVARAVPALIAGYAVLIHVTNLWFAGRIAQGSGLLTQPFPDISQSFRLPQTVGVAFLAGGAMSLFSGPFAAGGLVLMATMGFLLACQGLSVIHVKLRPVKYSSLLLTLLYFILGVLGWPVLIFTLIGLADLVFNYREGGKGVISSSSDRLPPKLD